MSYCFVRLLGADRIEKNFPYIVVTFLRERLFTGRRIETAVLLLLPVIVAVRMFMGIHLLLQKRPVCNYIYILAMELI
jgi:hypothetical protein